MHGAVKLLALDIDGTLIGAQDGVIDDRDRDAIARVRGEGVIVTLATGRLYGTTRKVAHTLQLSGPVICGDGAMIVAHPEGAEIESARIVGGLLDEVRDAVAGRGLSVVALEDDRVLLDESSVHMADNVAQLSSNVAQVDDVLSRDHAEQGMVALFAIGKVDAIAGAARALAARDLEADERELGMDVATLMVRARGASKGKALDWLAKHHGVALSDCVAVGDWLNDVSMLKAAGRSFAMAQAPQAVKEAASDMTFSVAEAIAAVWGS